MVLNTAGYLSFSQINSTVFFTNGNLGVNTTSPISNLDVNGSARIVTGVTTGTLDATTGITSPLAQITNVISTTVSTGTLLANTITGANLSLSGNLVVGGTLTTVNITSTNMLNTNISAGTINATGLTSLQNVTATNVSAGILIASTGVTIGTINATGLSTLLNATATNISAGILIATTGVTTGTINATGLSTLLNATATNISAGVLIASTGITSATANITSSTIGTLRVPTNLIAVGNSNTVGSLYTTGGNVGINTTTPTSTLSIQSTPATTTSGIRNMSNLSAGQQVGSIIGKDTGTYNALFQWYKHVGDGSSSNHVHYDFNGRDNALVLSGTGVGVGTTSPAYNLDVSGTTRVSSALTIGTGNTSAWAHQTISANGNFPMAFCSNRGSIASFLFGNGDLSTGYLSINHANYTLDVSGNGRFSTTLNINNSTTNCPINVSRSGSSDVIPTTGFGGSTVFSFGTRENIADTGYGLLGGVISATGTSWIQSKYTASASNLPLALNPLGGNVGVGTVTPAYTLDVNGTARIGGNVGFKVWTITGTHASSTSSNVWAALPSGCSKSNIISITGVTYNSNGDAIPFNAIGQTPWNISHYVSFGDNAVWLQPSSSAVSKTFTITIMTNA